MTLARLLLAASFAVLAGCAGAPPQYLARPPAHDGVYRLGRSAPLELESHTVAFLDEARRTRLLQNFGGGGVGVGVLLGPVGVLANAAGIKSTTKADGALLRGAFELNVHGEFAAAAQAAGFRADGGADGAPLVAPYFEIVRIDDERFALGAVLVLELGAVHGGWRGVYNSQLDAQLTRAELAAPLSVERRQAIAAALRAGFAEAIALARADVNGELPPPSAEVMFKSEYLTPRIAFEMAAQQLDARGDKVLLRTYGGVLSLQRDQVEIKVKRAGASPNPSATDAASR